MTEKHRGVVEILVHTTAPSRGKDDTYYRTLASAYLSFEPVRRLSLHDDLASSQSSASDTYADGQLAHFPLDSVREVRRRPNSVSYLCDEDIYDMSRSQEKAPSISHIISSNSSLPLESPQASFKSVLDNLHSPFLLRRERTLETPPPSRKEKPDNLVGETESSWEAPPSVIPDSQSPYNRVIPEFSSPTRVLELYLQHFDTSGSVSAATDTDNCRGSQTHYASSINLFLDSSQSQSSSPPQITAAVAPSGSNESLQIIRDTPYAKHQGNSNLSPLVRKKFPSAHGTAFSSEARCGFTASDRYHEPPVTPTNQMTPSPKRRALQISPLRKRRKIEAPNVITKHIQRRTPKLISPPQITPNEIHPAPPRTSSWGPRPALIITPALQVLATQLDLPQRYRPKTQTRPLRQLERGYWAVDTAEWPGLVRDQAWVALGAYLGQGRAGWGVWAVRSDVRTSFAGEEGPDLGLRVYCWGGLVGHIYLLLYLVSQRKVKGTGASWVDGGGEVVVCMP